MISNTLSILTFSSLLLPAFALPLLVRKDLADVTLQPVPVLDLVKKSMILSFETFEPEFSEPDLLLPSPEEKPVTGDIFPSITEAMPIEIEEKDPSPSEEAMSSTTGFYYNVGGGATQKFEADPEDWIVGETSAFEMPEAVISSDDTSSNIYKSHRYGLLGSTWGYIVPVDTPGTYECSLYYAETYSEFFTEEPNRTFTVEIGGDAGEIQTATFDVMVELGGQGFTPYERKFVGISVQSLLTIRETPLSGDAFLSGFACHYTGPLDI